ncbi:hypothetical protein FRC09_018350 [Ceratobasidium sp. 395]|nr:hypothetical protein FRC09_018350 [Ceratobasidium sp. 395]
MPPTILAPRSRIPTLKSRTKQTSSGTAGSQSTKAPAAEGSANTGSLTKKRGSATLLNTLHVSPNPKARKISRTNDEVATPPSSKRPRATSPVPPSSTRKRPRKSNHPTDFDYVPSTNGQRLTTPTPRRVTRQSLAAEEENLEEDPLDCLTGPGALDTSGDSPQHSARARSTTGFDFTLNGSGLMEGADVEISSGGLYSDLDEDENEQAETSIARMAGMGSTGKGGKRGSPAPRETTRPRASAASVPRQTSTTPRRPSQSSNTSRRPSRSPNVSRRTSTSTTRQTSATPRRQSTTPTPRRRTEPKTLPPPVLTLTAAQTRKEARLAAAQAEAEAKLRASLESDLSRLSVVGEEEEEGEGDGTIDQGAEEGAAEEEEWQDKDSEGEESDDPLAGASVYQSPRQSPRAANSLTTTPQTRKTPGTRKTTVTPGNKSKKLTPRTKSTSKRATPRVRWTPRSSGKRSVQSKSGLEHESRNEDGGSDVGGYF